MLTILNDTLYHDHRAGETIDAERRAWAAALVADGWPPVAAWLHAVKGWPAMLAKAYALLGNDAGAVIDISEALAAGRARKLFV